jgi:IS5 family transposase
MFKVLILQTLHSLSVERTEYLIKDRLSFMRFLGLGLADPIPDADTIWTFREALTKAGAIEALFRRFDQALKMSGYLAMAKQIVDATIVAVPQAAHHNRGEAGNQGRRCSGGMEGQACQGRPEESRSAAP